MGSRFLQARGSWSAHGLPWVSLSGSWLNLLCSCLCLFDTIMSYMRWMENIQRLSNWKWKWILCVIKDYLIHKLYFVYVVEATIFLHWKLNINTWVHFLACCKYVYICFHLWNSCIHGVEFHSDPHTSFRFPMKSPTPPHQPPQKNQILSSNHVGALTILRDIWTFWSDFNRIGCRYCCVNWYVQ